MSIEDPNGSPWWARLLNWVVPAIGRLLKRRSGGRPDQ
jgi:hypothetical protein